MKSIRSLFLTLALIVLVPAAGFGQNGNLVKNGGFEKTSDDSMAAQWKASAARGGKVEMGLDRNAAHNGEACFKVQFSEGGGRAFVYPENDITPIIPGRTYRLSLWIKTRNLGYSPNFTAPCVQFNFRPSQVSPYPVIDLMSAIERKGEWEEISLTSTAPSDARALTLKILLTKGTVWIDDVSITPAPDQ